MRTFLITTLTLLPATAFAGGYVIPDENAREIGLSQATVAAQTGADAVLRNPAALAGIEGLDVTASGELLVNRTDWSDPMLGSASLIAQKSFPPTASVAYGARIDDDMAWGAGLGFGVPAGGSLIWPSGWQGQERIQSVRQEVFLFAAAAAFQPMRNVKIGASLLRYQGQEELHQAVNYLDHYGDAGLGLSGGATTFGVAVEATVPNVPLTFGIHYKHSGDLALSGHAHFEAVPPVFQSMLHDQAVTETLTVPNDLAVGAAYDVMPDLKVMAQYSFERWSVYKDDTFVGADGFTVSVPRNYKNAHVIRVAGEYEKLPFLPALTARAGVLRSISPQPTDTVSPSLTDGDSWAISLGAGYEAIKGLRIDLGYQHAFFDAVTASGAEAFPGTYKTGVDIVSLGINWRTDLAFLKSE